MLQFTVHSSIWYIPIKLNKKALLKFLCDRSEIGKTKDIYPNVNMNVNMDGQKLECEFECEYEYGW